MFGLFGCFHDHFAHLTQKAAGGIWLRYGNHGVLTCLLYHKIRESRDGPTNEYGVTPTYFQHAFPLLECSIVA